MQRIYKTKSRSQILMYFKNHREQVVSAADIYSFLQKTDHKVNLATIYRNLDKMTKDGVLIKYMDREEERAVYQYTGDAAECSGHLHMQCTACGRVIHLKCNFMNEIIRHLSSHHQFALQCTKSILYGVCEECGTEAAEGIQTI